MLTVSGVVIAVVALAVVLPLMLIGGRHTTAGAPVPSPSGTSPQSSAAPSPSATVSTSPSTTSVSPTPPPTTTSPPASRSTKPTPPPTLLVRADRGICWLTVTDARGRTRYNGYVHRGEQRKFDGPFFRVTIGDAAAVTVVVNGVTRPRGKPGEVQRFTVTGR
jgi:cytoskeletal protein RodZ